MKLLELFSLATGLKIGKQFLLEKFYPLPDSRPYITIQGGSGMAAKNYAYFNEILDILAPILNANNVVLIQLGGPEDQPLKHCLHLQGKTDLHQSNYILSRAILHLGNDSWMAHRTGHVGVPVVEIFGSTSLFNHSPLDHPSNSEFIEAHRWDKNPSFAAQEFPSTINTIRPEQIINAILKILGSTQKFDRESYYIGNLYNNTTIEYIPNFLSNPNELKEIMFVARYDLGGAEEILYQALQTRKMAVVTEKSLNVEVLKQLKQNIIILTYKITKDTDFNNVKEIKRSGIKHRFVSDIQDEKELSELRLKFFELGLIEKITKRTKDNFWTESKQYLNFELDKDTALSQDGNLWFRSNKFTLSEGKIFLSKSAWRKNLPTTSFENNVMNLIDDPELWEDLDYFYIFKQKQQ
jgi:ADP-heptose:LPS heptosyltransferase